jgi:hypothetical protein
LHRSEENCFIHSMEGQPELHINYIYIILFAQNVGQWKEYKYMKYDYIVLMKQIKSLISSGWNPVNWQFPSRVSVSSLIMPALWIWSLAARPQGTLFTSVKEDMAQFHLWEMAYKFSAMIPLWRRLFLYSIINNELLYASVFCIILTCLLYKMSMNWCWLTMWCRKAERAVQGRFHTRLMALHKVTCSRSMDFASQNDQLWLP